MSKIKYDVVALGELLVDFTEAGLSSQSNTLFEANPGGAPCNVLAMLAKLQKKTAFIGKVGQDMFGRSLRGTLEKVGIDTSGLCTDPMANTTLAFVKNTSDGDREFAFFRNPGADTRLKEDEVKVDIVQSCRIFHFGSLSLTNEPARTATYTAVALARAARAVLSYDPNLRPLLWASMDEAKRQLEWGCAQCDILKVSDSELIFLAGCEDYSKGCDMLLERFPNIRLLLLTKGKGGGECRCGGYGVAHPAFLDVPTVDTTGAGDTFLGGCLAYVLKYGLERLADEKRLTNMLAFANAAAALVTTKKGVILSMPSEEEVHRLLIQIRN